MDNIETVEKVVGSYKNRVAPYLEPEKQIDGGNNIPKEPGNGTKEPGKTCEHCKYQVDGCCNRYPQRYIVRGLNGYLSACGEFKA